MDKKLYVIGGWNGQRGITRCDIFDTEMGEWSNMAPLSTGIFAVSLYIHIFIHTYYIYIFSTCAILKKC